MKKKLMKLHRQFIRKGMFGEAKEILYFLLHHSIVLGLSDVDWNVESELIRLGFKEQIKRNGLSARFILAE